MSDLVERQKVIDALDFKIVRTIVFPNDEKNETNSLVNPFTQYNKGLEDGIKAIRAIPSAESEQKKGKWLDEKINSYTSRTYCSECGSSALFVYKSDDYYGNHAHGETVKTKFCPNCGADMREDHEDIPMEYFENGGI